MKAADDVIFGDMNPEDKTTSKSRPKPMPKKPKTKKDADNFLKAIWIRLQSLFKDLSWEDVKAAFNKTYAVMVRYLEAYGILSALTLMGSKIGEVAASGPAISAFTRNFILWMALIATIAILWNAVYQSSTTQDGKITLRTSIDNILSKLKEKFTTLNIDKYDTALALVQGLFLLITNFAITNTWFFIFYATITTTIAAWKGGRTGGVLGAVSAAAMGLKITSGVVIAKWICAVATIIILYNMFDGFNVDKFKERNVAL